MTLKDIAKIRLANQQLHATNFTSVKEILGWMGAMQAQDYAMAKWAVGARLPGSTDSMVEKAIDDAEIIRTHVLRPTWHFVAATDIHWMLELTAPQIKAMLPARHKELELPDTLLKKSNRLIERAVTGKNQVTREDIGKILEKGHVPIDNNRLSHLLLWAELNGIVCSGIEKDNRHTYALLEERVPKKIAYTKDEAMAKLAEIYFLSRGPATIADFAWWSGLNLTTARRGMEIIKADFIMQTISGHDCWLSRSAPATYKNNNRVYLLPAFDEYIISYKERMASLPTLHARKVLTSNGIFWPAIVYNGQVIGTWKRTVKGDSVAIETDFFDPHHQTSPTALKKAGKQFGDFLKKKTII